MCVRVCVCVYVCVCVRVCVRCALVMQVVIGVCGRWCGCIHRRCVCVLSCCKVKLPCNLSRRTLLQSWGLYNYQTVVMYQHLYLLAAALAFGLGVVTGGVVSAALFLALRRR